jgi:hypothetical protein
MDLQSAMFIWRIEKFEDRGKEWCLPAEQVERYQFEQDSRSLDPDEIQKVQAAISKFQKPLIIHKGTSELRRTETAIHKVEETTKQWLTDHSDFFQLGSNLDFNSRRGPQTLIKDLIRYMDQLGFREQETRTSENIVLNPNSGEWVKGMEIVLAEMGLVQYVGKIPRTSGIFKGAGERAIRRSYLIHRLGFLRATFHLLGIAEVVLYRGMSTELNWAKRDRSLLSSTFSLRVAKSFAHFNRVDKYHGAYLLKFTVPVERLFMTYLETRAMNQRYPEAEAILLFDPKWTFIQ